MKNVQTLTIILILVVMLLSGCGEASAPEVADLATATAVPATPTHTPIPTDTPAPTDTAEPTNTPEPTVTTPPELTDTPEPTPTDEPPISSGAFDETELENGWIKYTLPEEQVAVAFPPEWTALKLSPEFLEETLAAVGENNEGTLSALSSEAVQSMASAGIKLMALDTDPDVITRATPTTANLLVIELPIELPFDSWVELNLVQLEALANEGTLESEIIEINGQEAARMIYTSDLITALGEADTVQIEQYLFKQEDMTYILTLAAQAEIADQYTELFPEIANTFEFLSAEE
jgi:hypothetical protein